VSARILVVDDVPANVKLLEARLSAEYFQVMTASSGADALKICERGECDMILLDVMMPDMDGFEVCRRLKSNPATHFIPVVMVTALDSSVDRVRGLEAGADDFLTKPVSDVVLIARVRSLTRLKMMTDELRSARLRPSRSAYRRRNAARLPIPARAVACCWSTTGRPLTSGWRRCFRKNTPWMSRPTRQRRCFAPPMATTTC
jgi:DNA-binding response OmpR family regulator